MSAVAIPPEIVGDTDTIRERRDEFLEALASTARCLGRHFTRTGEPGQFYLARLADEVSRYDLVEGEYRRRRFVADDLAHADERNPRFSHWVEPR